MKIKFTKMHGLGNDFMVVEQINQHCEFTTELIQQLSNRRTGVGFDQLLLVAPLARSKTDFSYHIFNADGHEVDQCGNGARCVAKFLQSKGYIAKNKVVLHTHNSVINLTIAENGQVTADMGLAKFEPAAIPLSREQQDLYTTEIAGQSIEFAAVSMGNPHAVIHVDDVNKVAIAELGAALQQHAEFPESVNVGFMQVISPEHIRLRVYERGAGETMACGSGACAAVVAGIRQGLLSQRVKVDLLGGALTIDWQGSGTPVRMIGPAATVYNAEIEIK